MSMKKELRVMDELERELIEAQNKYDDYKSRYEGFCNKDDWDDTYDHIAQNAMSLYLGTLLNKVETIKKLIDDLNKPKNNTIFPSNSLLQFDFANSAIGYHSLNPNSSNSAFGLKAINNPNVASYTGTTGLTEEEKRVLKHENNKLYEQHRTCSNCESIGEVKDIKDRITYYKCSNCDKTWER